MLVLTRKMQQEIKIGENITVTILRVKGNSIRIGIDAPQSVSIKRGELAAKEREERQSSAKAIRLGEIEIETEGDALPFVESHHDYDSLHALPPLASRLAASAVAH